MQIKNKKPRAFRHGVSLRLSCVGSLLSRFDFGYSVIGFKRGVHIFALLEFVCKLAQEVCCVALIAGNFYSYLLHSV